MATGDWFLLIFNNILKPIIPYGKFFSFVWCREHYRINNEGEYIKPLIEVYNAFPWYKENNTVIIDNTPSTFSDNKNNAVFITTFNNNKYDTELLKLITFFKYIFTKLHDEKQKQLNRFIH